MIVFLPDFQFSTLTECSSRNDRLESTGSALIIYRSWRRSSQWRSFKSRSSSIVCIGWRDWWPMLTISSCFIWPFFCLHTQPRYSIIWIPQTFPKGRCDILLVYFFSCMFVVIELVTLYYQWLFLAEFRVFHGCCRPERLFHNSSCKHDHDHLFINWQVWICVGKTIFHTIAQSSISKFFKKIDVVRTLCQMICCTEKHQWSFEKYLKRCIFTDSR